MDILLLLIPVSVVLVFGIGGLFWWSVRSGQFDDLDGPAHRILADDDTSDVIPRGTTGGDDRLGRQDALTSINPASKERR